MPNYNPHLVCPHCQVKGKVFTEVIKQKKGNQWWKGNGCPSNGRFVSLGNRVVQKGADDSCALR